MEYQILSVNTQEIFELSAIKNYLRISHDYDDPWLLELVECAICSAEKFLRISIIARKIKIRFDRVYNSRIILHSSPISLISEIMLHGDINIICSPENYSIKDQTIIFKKLSRFDYLTIEYIAGYINPSFIPQAIKQGMMLHIAEMYDSHGISGSISLEVQKLYQPYKRMLI